MNSPQEYDKKVDADIFRLLRKLNYNADWDKYMASTTWQESVMCFPDLIKERPYMVNCPTELFIKFFKARLAENNSLNIKDFPIALQKDLM